MKHGDDAPRKNGGCPSFWFCQEMAEAPIYGFFLCWGCTPVANIYALVMTNIAMEHGPFIDDFPSCKPPFMLGIFHGYVSHNQMVGYKHLPTGVRCQVRKFLPNLRGHITGSIFTTLSNHFKQFSVLGRSGLVHGSRFRCEKYHWVIKHSNEQSPSCSWLFHLKHSLMTPEGKQTDPPNVHMTCPTRSARWAQTEESQGTREVNHPSQTTTEEIS